MTTGLASSLLPRARDRGRRSLSVRTEPLLFLAALSLVVAAIHAAAAVPHMTEYPLYGGLFTMLALFQATWAIRIYGHPARALLRLAVVVNLGVVLVWVASRTTGLPIGPEGPGVPERVGFPDLAATVAELGLVGLALHQLCAEVVTDLAPWARQALLVLLIFGSVGAMAASHAS